MDLCGRTAWVPTQPWQLARSTGAAVVPCVVIRQPRQRMHQVILQQHFHVKKTRDRTADLEDAAARYGTWFSRWLKKRPSHYLPYLLLRRKVWDTDARPFFDDYPKD